MIYEIFRHDSGLKLGRVMVCQKYVLQQLE